MLAQNVNYPFPGKYGLSSSSLEPAPIVCKGFINCFLVFFSFAFKILIILSGSFAVIMYIWTGILLITKGHDEKARGEAKTRLIWGTIGLVIALLSYGLVNLIERSLSSGVSLINKAYAETRICDENEVPNSKGVINITYGDATSSALRNIINNPQYGSLLGSEYEGKSLAQLANERVI
ncbi:MAG: pilin, partial [Minisyncoccia bacterium]